MKEMAEKATMAQHFSSAKMQPKQGGHVKRCQEV
jgi:hypothetical protein